MTNTKKYFLPKGLSQALLLTVVCSFPFYSVSARAQATLPATQAVEQISFEGEPVSLKVVQISVSDFFRTISELSGLNILIDPEVSGSLTLNVEQVPWDQLFEAVLQSQGLAKRIEGNLVRISTQGKLRQEQEARQQLNEATFLAEDTITVSKRLNYATGDELMATLLPHLSPRGSMNVDERTNTLIISDIPVGIEAVNNLLEVLDVAELQVEIEARIIEASTSFARALGVQLGISAGKLDFEHLGDDPTITKFIDDVDADPPIRATRVGGTVATGINRPAEGFTSLGMFSTGGLLDVFRLDALITAAERDGEAKVLSKPHVMVLNNSEATITQGEQIPIPVTQNFTTTVQFQTAALRLTVRPRVTNVGTIMLTISVENNRPNFGRTVLGIPEILTSQAATEVLVKDGGTTVIGGIYVQEESESEDRVPGLGRIPLIGN
ncbi:MAG: type IV pilus secretin PilQ, partial [Acidobacteriota bacterium]